MKLTKDNLNKFYISNRGNIRYNKTTWGYAQCENCEEIFLAQSSAIRKGTVKYCSPECKKEVMNGKGNPFYGRKHTDKTKEIIRYKNSLWVRPKGKKHPSFGRKHTKDELDLMIKNQRRGKEHPNYKCGVNKCWYDTYAPQLMFYGVKCRRAEDNKNIIEVQCHLNSCKHWFKPNKKQARIKIYSLKTGKGENNLYCSEDCKQKCSTFRVNPDWMLSPIQDHIRYVQPELREMVFERDNYTCQNCGQRGGKLNCHHVIPINESPIESADVDVCITLCEYCHKLKHKINGCKLHDLQC